MAFAAKEEILRNIIKTHSTVLIEGWAGTGKTVTSLKAVRGLGDVYYYTESGAGHTPDIARYNEKLIILENAAALRDLPTGKQFVIFDDLNLMGAETRARLDAMIQEGLKDRKIIVITRVVLDAQDFLERVDAVVRFKHNTAQMLHSKLSEEDRPEEYHGGDGE